MILTPVKRVCIKNHNLLDFESYHVEYTSLSFVAHNTTHFPFYKIRCNKEVEEGHVYNILYVLLSKLILEQMKLNVCKMENLFLMISNPMFPLPRTCVST